MAEAEDKDLLTPVGDGADAPVEPIEDEPVRAADDEGRDPPDREDERVGHSDDDDEDDSGITPELKAKRDKRREEKRRKRDRERTELNFLRQRNEQLERRQSQVETRQTQTEIATIDGRISEIDNQLRLADQVYAEAIEKGAGADAAEAQRIRDQLRDAKNQLTGVKNQATQQLRQPQRQAATVDPYIAHKANEWVQRHADWYDPKGGNPDSAVAKAVESELYREGRLDPRTDDYWEEYDRRLTKYLPHRLGTATRANGKARAQVNDDEPAAPRQASGPTFRTGGRERSLKRGEVHISKERRAALEEMGVWEDPVLRQRYLKKYAEYDETARRTSN
jgi:hypothetical protein